MAVSSRWYVKINVTFTPKELYMTLNLRLILFLSKKSVFYFISQDILVQQIYPKRYLITSSNYDILMINHTLKKHSFVDNIEFFNSIHMLQFITIINLGNKTVNERIFW